jgi:hypothetical protein
VKAADTRPPLREWPEDDVKLVFDLVSEHGFKWKWIATNYFPGRSEDGVRNVYQRRFGKGEPVRQRTPSMTRRGFDQDEDDRLVALVLEHGPDWHTIFQKMKSGGRGRPSLRNRWSRYVLYGDRRSMTAVLTTSKQVDTVLRCL